MRNLASTLIVFFAIAATAQTLLVANQRDRTLSLIDASSAKQIAVIEETVPGQWGHEVAASPDGHTAYLPIYGDSGVGRPGVDGRQMLIVDIPSRKITGKIDFGKGVRPHCVVYEPHSRLLYITTELDQLVTIVDPKTLKITGSIPTGAQQSHMLVLSHDGRRAYTSNVDPGSVSVLDIPGRKTLTVIPISSTSQRISISNDDRMVFTADQIKPQIAVIDTSTNKLKSWVQLPAIGYGTAATKDGHSLLVAMPSADKVAVVDLASLKVAHTIDVCRSPQEILVRPDGLAYVSCMGSGQVAVVNPDERKAKATIEAGRGADGLAWAP